MTDLMFKINVCLFVGSVALTAVALALTNEMKKNCDEFLADFKKLGPK